MAAKRFDSWLLLIFLARIAMYANFMVYAACLPVLLDKWDMSATQAGSISSAHMIGYAASLFVFAWLADHFGAYLVAAMHLVGALASVSMGRLADRLGRRVVLIQTAAIGAGSR